MTNGLSNDEVIEKRKKYGKNEIIRTRKNTFFHLFIETLGDPIIKILLIVLAVKVIFLFRHFDIFETIGIAVAILVASLISTISEYGSEKAFVRLQEESSKIKCRVKRNGKIEEINIDEVTFTSIAYYLKKYNTLPDEIKEILSPKDAIVMFEDMEHIANGSLKGEKIGQGLYSKVYLNPWLEDYYILILDSPTNKDQYIYSKVPLGDSIWEDKDNQRIQLIKNAAA